MNIERVLKGVQNFLLNKDTSELQNILANLYAIQCGWSSIEAMCKKINQPQLVFNLDAVSSIELKMYPNTQRIIIVVTNIEDNVGGEMFDLTYTMDVDSSGEIQDVLL